MLIRIHNPDNRAISGRVFAFERKARLFTSTPKNQLAHPRARGIDRYQRFSLRRKIFVERLNDEQLAMPKRIVLDRGDDCSDYACELHNKISEESGVLSLEPESQSINEFRFFDSRL